MIKDIQFYIEDFKESKKILEEDRHLVPEVDIKIEQIDVAVKALDKADKYRWHDLRKNPDDLPEPDDNVLIKYYWEHSNDTEYYTDYLHRGKWSENHLGNNGEVIAWRYIEPFEEGDEE